MNWSSGLCGCCDDCSICCATTFLPCVTFGQVAAHVEGADSCKILAVVYKVACMWCFACLYTCGYRKKLRKKHNLAEEPCGDCCVHLWCDCCALTQEAREIKDKKSEKMASPSVVVMVGK
ncbi:hypothetical protein SUGI_1049600 [Cryptomeria japonica]|nr:hypothetical protein SUGI_1049600 [Cryptomeria japonica]